MSLTALNRVRHAHKVDTITQSEKSRTMSYSPCITYNNYIFHSGAFVPLTMEGTIIVDGVLASCYPSVEHDVAHFAVTPMRWFPGIADWVLGTQDGVPVYVKTCEHIAQWMFPHGLLYDQSLVK